MIEIPVHCGSNFTWTGNVGFCDACDLDSPISFMRLESPDSVKCYFYVKSHKTGAYRSFHLIASQKDLDGDLVYTKWQSGCGHFFVFIRND